MTTSVLGEVGSNDQGLLHLEVGVLLLKRAVLFKLALQESRDAADFLFEFAVLGRQFVHLALHLVELLLLLQPALKRALAILQESALSL